MGRAPVPMTPMRTPLKALIAAGNKLKVDPETFEVQLGPMKGTALNMEVVENVTTVPQRQVDANGNVTVVNPKARYETRVTIVWDMDSVKDVITKEKDVREQITEFMNRLSVRMDYGLEDDTFLEARD